MTLATQTAPAIELNVFGHVKLWGDNYLVKMEGSFQECYYSKEGFNHKYPGETAPTPTLLVREVSAYVDGDYGKEVVKQMAYLMPLVEGKGILRHQTADNVINLANGKVIKTYKFHIQRSNDISSMVKYWFNFVDEGFDSLYTSSVWNSDRYDWDNMLAALTQKHSQV